ncbi:MAG TPA: type II toxin-antitoxin system HicB family antitoxin [Acidimicrobiia bacterium]|nr:type II toxin-antitoxin system HicB family antitoxin [Acidimicrobiia bacterium]
MTRTQKKVDIRFAPDNNGRWFVEVIDEPRVHSHGQTLERAEANIREALALWYGGKEEDFVVVPEYDLPKQLASLVAEALELRHASLELERSLRLKARRAARQLTDRGVSRRDAARLLGISHQRVQQLLDQQAS